jgi:transcriptional regulator with XRE-family HTH domain
LKLEQAAEKAGISLSFWSDIEQGRRQPSVDTLTSIAEAFDVTTDYLLGRTDDPHGQGAPVEGTATSNPLGHLPPEVRKSIETLLEHLEEKYTKDNHKPEE